MSKKLSIIITHHNESEHIIAPLLTSINNQVGVDFNDIEIIISNNCDEPKIEFDINNWKNICDCTKIVYPEIKNKLGCSREYAVNQSNGEWTIFLDCDDKLHDDYTLFNIIDVTKSDADMYHCNEIHESFDDNQIIPITEGGNYVFLHGKIFRTSILKEIKFNKEELSDHEDIYSCMYLNGLGVREEITNITIYDWKFNPDSVTRVNYKEHDFLGLPDLLRCYYFVFSDIAKKKPDLNGHKIDILDFIRWKYCNIKSRSLDSDKYELEGLLALFIDTFDNNLECLQNPPPYQYEESYEDFINRIVSAYRNKTFPEWTYDILYTNYYSKWDIKIKKYREHIRLSHTCFCNADYDGCIENAKKALSLNESSYKAYILLSLAEHKKQQNEIEKIHSNIAYELYNSALSPVEFENECTLGEPWVYDELALNAYYDKNYILAHNWGKIACSRNHIGDARVNNNFNYYRKALHLNKNNAWITLLTDNSYINGELALVNGLKEVNTCYPIYCVITPDISEENKNILKYLGVNIIEVEKLIPEFYKKYSMEDWKKAKSLHCQGWHNALTKLKIFDLTQFDTIVYIDNDTMIYENMDELFTMPNMSAVPDCYGEKSSFCSGLLVIHPDHKLYESLISYLNLFRDIPPTEEELQNEDYGVIIAWGMIHDQLVLQHYFKSWDFEQEKHLPIWYHTWVTYFNENGYDEWKMPRVKAMHFIDAKPWVVGKGYFKHMIEIGYKEYGRHCLDYIDYIEKGIKELREQGIESPYLGIPD